MKSKTLPCGTPWLIFGEENTFVDDDDNDDDAFRATDRLLMTLICNLVISCGLDDSHIRFDNLFIIISANIFVTNQ